MMHVSISIFQGLLKNIILGSVAFVMGYFRFFFTQTGFFTTFYVTLSITISFFYKKSFTFLLLKTKRNHGDSVKNESTRANKIWRGGGPNAPPPACLGLNSLKSRALRVTLYLHNKILVILMMLWALSYR